MLGVRGGRQPHHILDIAVTGTTGVNQSGCGLHLVVGVVPVTQNGGVGVVVDAPHIHIALLSDDGTIVASGIQGCHIVDHGLILIGSIHDPVGEEVGLLGQCIHQRPQNRSDLLGIVNTGIYLGLHRLDLGI